MNAYLNLLRTQGVLRLLAGSMPARLAYGMLPLALFFSARAHTHSLAIAGLAMGANSATASGGAALRGSLVDRFGQTRPLLGFVPVYAAMLTALTFLGHDAFSVVGLSAAAGLVSPPINMSTRPLWKSAVRPDQVRSAWALDSMLLEITAVLGPPLATALALGISPGAALLTSAGLMLVGGFVMLTSPLSRGWVGELRDGTEPGLLRSPSMRLLCAEGLFIGFTLGALAVAVPSSATLAGHAGQAAPLLAVLAVGSMVGTIRAGGKRARSIRPLDGLIRSVSRTAVLLLALPFAPPGWQMALVLLAVGFVFGPANVFYLELVDSVRPRGRAVGALGFLWTIEGVAGAGGSALAGQMAQAHGARPALALVSVAVFGSPLVLRLGRRILSDASSGKPLPVEIPDLAVPA